MKINKVKDCLIIFVRVFFLFPQLVLAATTTVTSTTGFEQICNRDAGLASCIQKIYLLSLGLGSIVALLMIVLAGYSYMTAGGNAQQVESAKGSFESAFIGLIIIFVAFILLNLINPDLVRLRNFDRTLTLPEIRTGR